MQKSKLGSLGLAMGVLVAACAGARAEAPKISGFIDTTYNYNFKRPVSRTNAFRSFDMQTDVFLLNAAQVNIEGGKDGIGYYAELAFGTDASVYKSAGSGNQTGLTPVGAPSNPNSNFELQEAFLTYKCPMTSLQLKAGKFATTQGIEVIESKDNFTITRGFLFGMTEAFTHTGAMVGYAFPKYLDIWVGAVNGWDLYTDNNTGKTLVSKVGLNLNEMFWGSVSLLHGAEQAGNTNNARTNIDTTWFIQPIKPLTVALQAIGGQEDNATGALAGAGKAHWYGFTVQPKVDVTDNFFVGARYEWLDDVHGARTAGASSTSAAAGVRHVLQNITLAPGVNLSENLMARVEFRYDWSSVNNTFEDNSSVNSGFTQSHQSTVATQLVYKF